MNDGLKKAKGKVKEVAGSVTGDESLEAKGKIEQKAVDVKQKVAGKANEIMDKMDKSGNSE